MLTHSACTRTLLHANKMDAHGHVSRKYICTYNLCNTCTCSLSMVNERRLWNIHVHVHVHVHVDVHTYIVHVYTLTMLGEITSGIMTGSTVTSCEPPLLDGVVR